MKKTLLAATTLAFLSISANASILTNTVFGEATDSSGIIIPDGTLWALVVSTDAGDNFAGGFGLGGSITSSTAASLDFTKGQVLTVGGFVGADTVFAIGGFSGGGQGNPGYTQDALDITLGGALTTGKSIAFYYFPNQIYTATGTNSVGSQVGGLNATTINSPGSDNDGLGMIVPADGGSALLGALLTSNGGTVSNFKAVDIVPEPSSAFLTVFGVLGLFRRRRN
jgi:hypothetical protein